MSALQQPSCMKIYCELYNDDYQALSDISKEEILKKDTKKLSGPSKELDYYLELDRKNEIEFCSLIDKVLEKNPRGVESYLNEPTEYKKEELSIETEISEWHPKFYLIMLAAHHRHAYYINDETLHKKECEIVSKVRKYKTIDKELLNNIEERAGKEMMRSIGGPLNAIAFYKVLQNVKSQNR